MEDRSRIGGIGEQLAQKGELPEQGGQQQHAAIAVLNVGRGDQRVQHQAEGVDQQMALLAVDQLAAIEARRLDAEPPCILPLPMPKQSASLSVDGSPQPPRIREPVKKQGAPSTGSKRNPNSRQGRMASPHSQERVMEQPATTPSFVGIDVSKERLDVHVRPSGQAFAIARDSKGLEQLVSDLRGLAPALIVLEATGGFELTVAAALAGAGLPLAVVNPRQIRDFARATGRLAKTDRLDAEAIALFAERVRPGPRPVPDADARALAELVARRRQIVEMIGMEQNRRRQARAPTV